MFKISKGYDSTVVVEHVDGAITRMFHPHGETLSVTGPDTFELSGKKYRVAMQTYKGLRSVRVESLTPPAR